MFLVAEPQTALNVFFSAACLRKHSGFGDFFEHVDLNFGLTCNRLLTRKHNMIPQIGTTNAFLVLHAFVKTLVLGLF